MFVFPVQADDMIALALHKLLRKPENGAKINEAHSLAKDDRQLLAICKHAGRAENPRNLLKKIKQAVMLSLTQTSRGVESNIDLRRCGKLLEYLYNLEQPSLTDTIMVRTGHVFSVHAMGK